MTTNPTQPDPNETPDDKRLREQREQDEKRRRESEEGERR